MIFGLSAEQRSGHGKRVTIYSHEIEVRQSPGKGPAYSSYCSEVI
jgi:hypothetical protein